MQDIEIYKTVISSSLLFRNINDLKLNDYISLFDGKTLSYKKNEFVHRPYEQMYRFGLVLSGIIHVCIDDIDGNRMIMAEVHPGITFGESLCFLQIPDSPVYAYSFSDCTVLWLSLDLLYSVQGDISSEMQRRFTGLLASRALNMNNRIQILSKLTIREKLLAYFNERIIAEKSMEFTIPFTRDDLAAYIGTNRSALSRELSNMKKEGIIDFFKNSIKIKK